MNPWLLTLEELTPDQLRAVELKPSEHRLIFGGPGSGKTQVLLHRARHLMDLWNVSPEHFRIFVFTKVLTVNGDRHYFSFTSHIFSGLPLRKARRRRPPIFSKSGMQAALHRGQEKNRPCHRWLPYLFLRLINWE